MILVPGGFGNFQLITEPQSAVFVCVLIVHVPWPFFVQPVMTRNHFQL